MKTFDAFETEICSRCHGSGEHSFNLRYGRTCFKCSGQKKVLTKRGAAAMNRLNQQCKRQAKDIKIGDIIKATNVTHAGELFKSYAKVTAITEGLTARSFKDGKWEEIEMICINFTHAKYGDGSLQCSRETEIIIRPDNYKELVRESIEFQENLTKAGKEKKNERRQGSQ